MKQYEEVEVVIGELPEWYIEEYHDQEIEPKIREFYGRVAENVVILYNYKGGHTVKFFDHAGIPVLERVADKVYWIFEEMESE